MPTIEITVTKRYEVEVTTDKLNELLRQGPYPSEDWRDVELELERLAIRAAACDHVCGQTDVTWQQMGR